MIDIDAVRVMAGQARETYEAAASHYAMRLSQLAALLVRAQKPTATLLVFDQDEETVTADTTIEIVSVHGADGADLGELDWPISHEVADLIRTAYDSSPGFHAVASQDVYDTESVGGQWQDHNLLELHIDILLTDHTLLQQTERAPDMFDTRAEAAALGVTVKQTAHPHRSIRALHETLRGVDEPGQTYTLIRTYDVGGSKVRVTVHIDDYRQQSRLLAEAWDGKGWTEVVGILGQDPLVADGLASGYLPRERSNEKRQSLERAAGELLQRCLQVIAAAPLDDDSTWLSPTTAAYQAFVGCFSDPTMALLDLAGRAGIAVAYLDRGAIEADSRPLADNEWDRIAYHLAGYDEHVSDSGDLNAAFLDHLFAAAGLERDADGSTEDHDSGNTGH